MAENEKTGGAGEGGESGIGMNVSVVLTPDLDQKTLTGEIDKSLKSSFENQLNSLFNRGRDITQAFDSIQKVVAALSKSRSFRKHPGARGLSGSIDSMMKKFDALGDVNSKDAFGAAGRTSEFSHSLSKVITQLQDVAPKIQDPRYKRQRSKLGDALNVDSLLKNIGGLTKSYNQIVEDYSKVLGIGTKPADPRLQGTRVDTRGFINSSVVGAGRRQDFRKAFTDSFVGKMDKVGPTRGLTFDVETANWANDIWSAAFKTEKGGMQALQRNLKKDGITPDRFHKGFAQGIKEEAGNTAATIVSRFHDAYAASGGIGGLKGTQLPPITGHNLDFDLQAMKRMAEQVVASTPQSTHPRSNFAKASTIVDTMSRLLPGGDQRAVAEAGDTAMRWAEFMRTDLGYVKHASPKSGQATMGNTLTAIMKGLGVEYDAHDAAADTAVTDRLRRSLDSREGRAQLKKNFNYDRWLEGARESVFQQELSQRVPQTQKHLITEMNKSGYIPSGPDGTFQAAVHEAREATSRKVTRLDTALRQDSTSTVEVNDPEAIRQEQIKQNKAASTELRRHLNSQIEAVTKGKNLNEKTFESMVDGILQDTDSQKAINKVLDSYHIADPNKRAVAGDVLTKQLGNALKVGTSVQEKTYASKEAALSAEADRILEQHGDSFSLDEAADFGRGKVNLAPLADRNTLIANALNNSFAKSAAIPTLTPKTKTLTKEELRVSDLAMMHLDPSHPAYRSMKSLKEQYAGKTTVKDTIAADAAERGNVFEDKGVDLLNKKFGDRYETIRTGKDQANLKIGPFAGHPDGYLFDKKTGERTLFEAKYRNAEDRAKVAATGKLPPNYLAQASAYALASGVPDMATTFMFGDLQAASPELQKIDKVLSGDNITAKKRGELEKRRAELEKSMAISDLDVGALEMVRVAPDKKIQGRLLADMSEILGKKITPENYMNALKVPSLPADIQKFLAAGKNVSSPQELNSLIAARNKQLGLPTDGSHVSNILQAGPKVADKIAQGINQGVVEATGKTVEMAIGQGGGPTAPPKPPKGGGGDDGGDDGDGVLAPDWRPKVGLQLAEQIKLVQKELDKATVQSQKATLSGQARQRYIQKTEESGRKVEDKQTISERAKEDFTFAKEKRIEAQGLSAKLEDLKAREAAQSLAGGEEVLSRTGRIDAAAIERRVAQIDKAKSDALSVGAAIKDDGLTTESLKKGFAAATQLEKLGLAGTEGFTKQELFRKANQQGVGFDDLKLKDLSAGLKTQSTVSGLKGQTGFKETKLDALEATKAVDGLFKQLAQHTGKDFMSKESKSIQGFITASQEAQEKAAQLRAKATAAQEVVAERKSKGFKATAFEKEAAAATAEADRFDQEAISQARKAEAAAKELSRKQVTPEQYRDQFVQDRSEEQRKLRDTKAQLEGRRLLPGYKQTRADRDQLDLVNRRLAALKGQESIGGIPELSTADAAAAYAKTKEAIAQLEPTDANLDRLMQLEVQADQYGKIMAGTHKAKDFAPVEDLQRGQLAAQKFDKTTELDLSTEEAKAELNAFQLQAQQKSVRLKVDVDLQGMTSESLQAIVKNNLDLAKQGLSSPGLSTNEALNQALRSGVQIGGPKTQGFTGYFDAQTAKQPTILGDNSTAFSELMNQNKLAEQTVKQLYGALNQTAKPGENLSQQGRALFEEEKRARQTVDLVKQRGAAEDILRNEAAETKDPQDRAEKLRQADEMRQRRLNAEIAAKRQLAALEVSLHKARIDPRSAQAQQAHTSQIRSQLALEKEQLIIERQRLNALVQMSGNRHATQGNLNQISQLNQQLSNRFNVGVDPGGLNQTGLNQIAKSRGIDQANVTSGAKSKDFVGGAIDLLDWQLQWLAGVSILNTFSGAIKNSIGFAIEYEAQMKNVKLITEANTAEMEDLTGEVERLATSFQYSASELAEGLIILGQAGFTAVESLSILPSITALATATLSNLKMAADVTTTAIEAFNVPMARVPALVNTLAAMTIESKLDIEKLGTSFNYIASTASAAGFSIEETGAAMGLMSNAGVRASTIGTSLRSAIGSLMNPTAKFRKALADVGLSANDVSPVTNRLGDIFIKLKDAGFDVGSAFAGLDKRIAGGVITLVESANEFDSFEASITGTNRAFEMAEGQMDTFHAQVKRMRNSFQLLGGSWFEGDLEPLKEAAKIVTSVIRVLKTASDLVPDTGKSIINSTIALTTGLSLAKGVGGGVFDTVANIQRGLGAEDKLFAEQREGIASRLLDARTLTERRDIYKERSELAKNQKRGSTLTGRNQKVYSTFKTLFNPAMIGVATGMVVALKAFGAAADFASGKTAVLANTKLADQLSADIAVLETATDSLKKVSKGTLEYASALRSLKKLGLDVYNEDSPQFLEQLERQLVTMRVRSEVAKDELFKSQVTRMQSKQTAVSNFFNSEDEQDAQNKSNASLIGEFIRRRGLFFSGSQKEIEEELIRAGVDIGTDEEPNEAFDIAMQTIVSARQGPGFAAKRAVEARDGLLKAISDQEDVQKELEKLESKYQFFRDSRIGDRAQAVTEADRLREMGPVFGKSNQLDDDVARFSEDYVENTLDLEGADRFSGSQLDANQRLDDAFEALKKVREKLEEADNYSDDNTRLAMTDIYTKELKAAQRAFIVASRSRAFKVGLAGLPTDQVELADNFLSLLTTPSADGNVELDASGITALQGVDVTSLKALSKKMEALNQQKLVEESELTSLVQDSDGNLLQEVQASINIKYKLKAEEITQAEMDSAFKPLQTVFSKITAMMDQQINLETGSITSAAASDIALLENDFAQRGIAGSEQFTQFGRVNPPGYYDTRHTARGYSAGQKSQDKVEMELAKLRLKQQKDQQVFDATRAGKDAIYEKQKQDLALRSFATEQARNEARLDLDRKYHNSALELSRKRKTQLEADLKSIQAIREQHVSRIQRIQQVSDKSKDSAGAILDKVRAGRPQEQESAQAITRRAFKSYAQAKELFKQNRFAEAETASKEAFSELDKIASGGFSQEDKERAGRSAIRFSQGIAFTADDLVSAEKAALKTTEDLLTQIRDAIGAGSSDEEPSNKLPGTKYSVKPEVITRDKEGNIISRVDQAPLPETNVTGTENIKSNEEKVKTLQDASITNYEVLSDRLESSIKTLSDLNGGMVENFVNGLASGLPAIARQMGEDMQLAFAEKEAIREQAKKDAGQEKIDLSLSVEPNAMFDVKVKEKSREAISEDLNSL